MTKQKENTQINSEKSKRGSELGALLHSSHIVKIEKLIVGGEGLARIPFQDKSLVVFVPKSAPGDEVKIKITRAEKNHLSGEIIEIINPSSSRREAPCEYFESCGGCSWQHITENEQVDQKEKILTDLLRKFIPEKTYTLLQSVKSDLSFNYRNRIQLKSINGALGYFKRASHDVVDIDYCLIAEKAISDQIKPLKQKLKPSVEIKKIELRINHLNQFEHYEIGADGEGLSFSQVNNNVNAKLVSSTVSLIEKINPSFMTELYAGAGNFTFSIFEKLPNLRLEAAELNSKLTSFATQKIIEKRLQKQLTFFTTDCESYVARRSLSNELVLLDPPRAGCSVTVLNQIIKAKPLNVVYVSCHPVNLARDLKAISTKCPEYEIRHLQIFDMFPQTDHFETLVWLKRP